MRTGHPDAVAYRRTADAFRADDFGLVKTGADGIVHTAWTDFRGWPGVTFAKQDVYVANYIR